ncbi:type II toxin-antitoxin system RelE/ParE family toxin [Glutamicibacter sp. M10]|uniref:type II toxin-antitoxin system RelE/ParE family toxin n=1 Tax=Glutamicibacter sp. M10 TaxID=3023076 RepID=UPI001036DA91|nr:plasmid maintenance system killer protein [Arthrobacter sp. S41]
MKVSFKGNKLEKLCTDEIQMHKRRPDLKKKLRLRFKALEASDTLANLVQRDPGGRWHPLQGERAGTWASELSGNWRLIIQPIPNEPNAREVTVLEITDYH